MAAVPKDAGMLAVDATFEAVAKPGAVTGKLELAGSSQWLRVPGWLEGPLSFGVKAELRPENRLQAETTVDVSRAVLALPFAATPTPVPSPAPITLTVAADMKNLRQLDWSLRTERVLGHPLRLSAVATLAQGYDGLNKLEVGDGSWGEVLWQGATLTQGAGVRAVRVDLERLNVDQIWRQAVPYWPVLAGKQPAEPVAPAIAGVVAFGTRKLAETYEVTAQEVLFAPGHKASDFQLRSELADGRLVALAIEAREGKGNRVNASLVGVNDAEVKLVMDDMAAWLVAISSTVRAMPPPGPEGVRLADDLQRVSVMFGGGRFTLEGRLPSTPGEVVATGRLTLENARVLKPPTVLKLLALKSGRAMQVEPLIQSLVMEKFTVSANSFSLAGMSLSGAGLVDRLNVSRALYELETEIVDVAGTYWGVGIEIAGTRSKPEIFLSENVLVRAISTDAGVGFE
jgi:hypothetical protein